MNTSKLTEDQLIEGILSNDVAILGRAITLIESSNTEHQKLAKKIIERCILIKHETIRIGVTGVPGAGKSTFIEQFGKLLTGNGQKSCCSYYRPLQ